MSAARFSLFFVFKACYTVHNQLTEKISELAESVLSGTDIYLVEVKISHAKKPEIWIYADADDRSINMDECAKISNELSFLMEAHELLDGAYRLNVSSPGLSRPLVKWRQYPKNKGRKVKVKYKNEEGYHKAEGTLKEVDEQEIVVERQQDKPLVLPFKQIVETKIIPSFK